MVVQELDLVEVPEAAELVLVKLHPIISPSTKNQNNDKHGFEGIIQ